MPQDPRSRAAGRAAALAPLILLGAGLRLWGLAGQSIWVDESFTVAYAGIFDGWTWNRFFINLQGPLHALLLHLWSAAFGTSAWSLRSLEALIGTATIPLLWWALRPLDRPRVAWTACALLAVSPFHVWYSQEVRGYILLILSAVVSMGAFLRLPGGGRRMWLLYTLANVCGLLSNLSHLFLLLAQSAVLLLSPLRSVPLRSFLPRFPPLRSVPLLPRKEAPPARPFPVRGLWASWALTLLLLSPWLVQFWQRRVEPSGALDFRAIRAEEKLRGETSSPLLGIPYTYSVFSVGTSYGPSLREYREMARTGGARRLLREHGVALLWAALVFAAAAALGAVSLLREGWRARAWLLLALVPVLLTYGASLRNLKVFNPRYAAVAFPAYLLVLSEGIWAPRRVWMRAALAGAVLLPMGVSVVQERCDPRYCKEDARAAASFIRQEAKPGDALFFVGTDLPFRLYYWAREPKASFELPVEDAWLWLDRPREERLRLFEELLRGHGRVLVLFLRSQEVDPGGEWADYLRRAHPPERTVEFTGAQIWILQGGSS